jgi:DNA-binding PadR family transcriptional regulator
MGPPLNPGEFEPRILVAMLRLRGDASGVTIRAELPDRAGRYVAPGALYTALQRLEMKGHITSRMI